MADYEYDVFISYRRDGPVEQWVDQWFEEFLSSYLSFELEADPRIFRDASTIRAGDKWREVIESALTSSKCLVPIYTPPYFRSAWCDAEWRCFLQRERETGKDLIVPVQWHDSTRFPPEAKLSQFSDFRAFAFSASAFRDTQSFIGFESKMKEFCRDLAAKIERAPGRNPEWTASLPSEDRQRRSAMSRPALIGVSEHA